MSTWYSPDTLADGTPYTTWERPVAWTHTYHVDQGHPEADDAGPGTPERPFATIARAAQALMPGERVIIGSGTYREVVRPPRGGTGPKAMIGYEAAPGAEVVISGAVRADSGWRPSEGWNFSADRRRGHAAPTVYELDIAGLDYQGYNPFGMVNVLQDRFWLWHKRIPMEPFFLRRGMIYVDGARIAQCEHPSGMGRQDGAFFIHHNGTRLYLRMPGDVPPDGHAIELVIHEQAFAPAVLGLGYIRLKGLTFRYAANGFPVPQRGLVSTSRGHHFIIEDCAIEAANAVGLDMGNECWNAMRPTGELGSHILRGTAVRDCGVCGLAAMHASNMLVEDCLFEDIGYQNCEHMYESAGVKFHNTIDLMYRRNVMRRVRHASGLWMDCGNKNNRISGNLFYDIDTRAGAVHYEGTHFPNRIDHNIIGLLRTQDDPDGNPGWGGTAIQAEGTDFTRVDHNLVFDCENDGFYSNPVQMRIIDGRGGVARLHDVRDNIFSTCGRTAVTFHTEHNALEHNLYLRQPRGFIHIGTAPGGATAPESVPQMRLDLDGARTFIGWEKCGLEGDEEVRFVPETMTLSMDAIPEGDFGPFGGPLEGMRNVDPRAI